MISAIAAVDENLGIGYKNELLCSIKEDLKRFKELTTDNIVIMGSKTWESLPTKPLPNRVNIVVTNKVDSFSVSNGVMYIRLNHLKEAIVEMGNNFDVFVIGGGQIYKELLPYCNRIYLTRIEKSFENVDTYFPEFKNNEEWVMNKIYTSNKQDDIKYHFEDYTRKNIKRKKQTFIINGSGGVGKDTFVSFVADNFSTMNVSSVDKVKEIARIIGWNGAKTERDRKFLSDLKLLCTDYCDMPLNSMKEKFKEFNNDEHYNFLFLHIREPEEIEKAKVAFNAKTILIKNDSVKHITSNMADENVYNYDYDVVINNNGSLEELMNKSFCFAKDSLNDKLKEEY